MSTRLIAAALAVCLAPLAARAADDDNPYKNVKVGDFATYKMETKVANFTITGDITQTVTAKTEKEATVKATGKLNINGMMMDIPAAEQKIDLTKPYDPTKIGGAGALPPGVDVAVEKGKEGKEKVKVAGKEYDATWTDYTVKAKVSTRVWSSKVKRAWP